MRTRQVQTFLCKVCGGSGICEHGNHKKFCKDCWRTGICEHGRRKYGCKDCNADSMCKHGGKRVICKLCSTASCCDCEHGKLRKKCSACRKSSPHLVSKEHTAKRQRIAVGRQTKIVAAAATARGGGGGGAVRAASEMATVQKVKGTRTLSRLSWAIIPGPKAAPVSRSSAANK